MNDSRLHDRAALLAAVVVVLAVQTLFVLLGFNSAPAELTDPDSYMRLERIRLLHETGIWYDAHHPNINAPYGERLHWTRPLDAILYAGAWLGSAVTDFDEALYAWGLVIGPLMLLVLVPVWSLGTRSLLTGGGLVLAFAALLFLPRLTISFWFGNADHHGLLALLFMAALAICFQIAFGRWGARAALFAGVLAGVALWVSVEALVAATMFGAALALLWVWRGDGRDRHLTLYLAGLLLAVSIALPVERPPGEWLSPHFERISVVHWLAAAAAAASWLLANAVRARLAPDSGVLDRGGAVAAAGLVAMLFMAMIYPKFFLGPFAALESEVFEWWVNRVDEYLPTWPTSRTRAAVFLTSLGPAIVASGYIARRWISAPDELRRVFAVVLLGYVVFVPLALMHYRWVVYVQALALLPLAMAASDALQRSGIVRVFGQTLRLRLVAVASILAGPLILSIPVAPANLNSSHGASCDRTAIIRHLASIHEGEPGGRILFTYIFWGSEIAWRTPYRAVAAPYGNERSLSDTKDFFTAATDESAREIVARRGVDLVLVCTAEQENRFYTGEGSNLLRRLIDRAPPPWLEPVALPAEMEPGVRLYRVRDEGPGRRRS